MDVNVKVAVRCRPMSSKETSRGCNDIVQINSSVKSLTVKSPDTQHEEKTFTFDYVYGSDSTQIQVYKDLGDPIITQALDGFNGTIFAYGQTGSGKTFSMMGNEENKGIIPQLNEELWNKINAKLEKLEYAEIERGVESQEKVDSQFLVTVSFLEVYNEDIKDLLNPNGKNLKIHESPDLGIFVDGLCELVVKDAGDIMRLIYQGNAVRHVGATQMNDASSRSHSVFTLKIEQRTRTTTKGDTSTHEQNQMIKAKVNLVDLAGSERVSKTNATGQTLKEGANINKSLLTLGNVINALSEGRKNKVIPYRESKLTRLLQESLGGNAATIMIASISPADYNYSETISTLKYANRAKSIENAVKRNEDTSERMIRDLQQQIEALKAQLKAQETNVMNNTPDAPGIDPELQAKLEEMQRLQMDTWEEKERLSKQLESEREGSINIVLGQMMNNVKEQKVGHMKNIKRLTNEKAMLLKAFKDDKELNITLKQQLDTYILQYQQYQSEYDTFINETNGVNSPENDAKAEELTNRMIPLLTQIELLRGQYTEKRESLNRMKKRLEKIEVEITDERAELVTNSNILLQNDKIREQIQQEEKLKMENQFQLEVKKMKKQLELESQEEHTKIQNELTSNIDTLTNEIKMLKSLNKMESSKNEELTLRFHDLQNYCDQIESRLADSEVNQESLQEEMNNLTNTLQEKETTIQQYHDQIVQLTEQSEQLTQQMIENQKHHQETLTKVLEEAKYDLFAKLMDSFQEERKLLELKHQHTQKLLAQATKDILHLSQRNQELEMALNQAIFYEPAIN